MRVAETGNEGNTMFSKIETRIAAILVSCIVFTISVSPVLDTAARIVA